MNKAQLVAAAAAKIGDDLSQKDVRRCLDALTEVITEAIADKDKVTLVGFGTFDAKLRQAREGRNPSNGLPLTIPEKMMPRFTPGKELKEAVAAA